MNLLKDIEILVADDEPILRGAIRFELEMEGAIVSEASSGQEAFKLIKENNFKVVLSDVKMSGVDGVELLDNIKKLDSFKPIVMLITGFSELNSDDALKKGCSGFISKPFDPEELVQQISNALKNKRG